MRLSRLTCSLSLIFAALTAGSTISAEEHALKVATFHSPPFAIIDTETGAISGSAIEAAKRMAKRCRASLRFVVSPAFSRAYRMTVDGTVDALVPVLESAERTKFLFFPQHPVDRTSVSLMVKSSSNLVRFTDLSILEGKSVGRLAGGLVTPDFDAYVRSNEINLLQRHSYQSLLENLAGGRLDFIAGPRPIFEYYAQQLGYADSIRALEPSLDNIPGYMALSRQRLANNPQMNTVYDCLMNMDPTEQMPKG